MLIDRSINVLIGGQVDVSCNICMYRCAMCFLCVVKEFGLLYVCLLFWLLSLADWKCLHETRLRRGLSTCINLFHIFLY